MPSHAGKSKPLFGNSTYDVLKFVALIFLPALATLYFGLAGLWHWPHTKEVVGSISAADTFLGLLLGLAKKAYCSSDAPFDGNLNVTEDEGGNKTVNMELTKIEDPHDIDKKSQVTFKVNKLQT